MKKLVLATIMMLVPFTSFALDKMNDAALDKMTAQEGVTITFADVKITQTPADMAWTDGDGIGAGTSAGTVFIHQTGDTNTTITGSLTIDVATATADIHVPNGTLADAVITTGTSFVKIGLPNISQSTTQKTMKISMNNTVAAGTALGTLYQDAGTTSVSGSIFIYAH